MDETPLQALKRRWREALKRRWRGSEGVDDELAYLEERARRGEPRRRALGAPLQARTEALAQLYAAGRRQELLGQIAAERDAAGQVWFDYWDALHSGLDPQSKLYREGIAGGDYRIADRLMVLRTRHGQPLAKAILCDLGPRYADLPLAESRIVRTLGKGLDPREDLEARRILVDLLERWEIDQKSRLGFLTALSRAGLDACLPLLEKRLARCVTDQQLVLELLTSRDEATPSRALRAACETWEDPSWLVFQLMHREDREAVPILRVALGRLAPGAPEAQMVELALAALVAGEPAPASLLGTLRDRMYGRLGLNRCEPNEFFADMELEDTSPSRTSLREQLLDRVDSIPAWLSPCDRFDELARWHGLDPRLSSELALVILAEAARRDRRSEVRGAARRAIWNLGMLEID